MGHMSRQVELLQGLGSFGSFGCHGQQRSKIGVSSGQGCDEVDQRAHGGESPSFATGSSIEAESGPAAFLPDPNPPVAFSRTSSKRSNLSTVEEHDLPLKIEKNKSRLFSKTLSEQYTNRVACAPADTEREPDEEPCRADAADASQGLRSTANKLRESRSIRDLLYASGTQLLMNPKKEDQEEDDDEDGEPRTWMDHVVVKVVCSTVILLNSVFIGIHTEKKVEAKFTGVPESDLFNIVEQAFCAFFAVELLLRLLIERKDFLFGADKRWNLFDTVLVLQSVSEFVPEEYGNPPGPNLSFARILRIFRFGRILRLIRVVRVFHSFRLMVLSIMGSMVSLLWVFVLLFVIIYGFSILFLHGVSEADLKAIDEETSDMLRTHYGSVYASLMSLFMAISGGMDWADLMQPLDEVHDLLGYGFALYVFFMFFGVLNVVVATFVDSAFEISKKDAENIVQEELEKNAFYARSIREFFQSADKDGSNSLSWEEFQKHLDDKRVQAYFTSLQLDVSQARALFLLLDTDENDQVDIEQFVCGCMRLKGEAKSIDVNMIMYENEKLRQKLAHFMDFVDIKFLGLEKALSVGSISMPEVSEGAWQREARLESERRKAHLGVQQNPFSHEEDDPLKHMKGMISSLQGRGAQALRKTAQASREVNAKVGKVASATASKTAAQAATRISMTLKKRSSQRVVLPADPDSPASSNAAVADPTMDDPTMVSDPTSPKPGTHD